MSQTFAQRSKTLWSNFAVDNCNLPPPPTRKSGADKLQDFREGMHHNKPATPECRMPFTYQPEDETLHTRRRLRSKEEDPHGENQKKKEMYKRVHFQTSDVQLTLNFWKDKLPCTGMDPSKKHTAKKDIPDNLLEKFFKKAGANFYVIHTDMPEEMRSSLEYVHHTIFGYPKLNPKICILIKMCRLFLMHHYKQQPVNFGKYAQLVHIQNRKSLESKTGV